MNRYQIVHLAVALLLILTCFSCHDTIFEVPQSIDVKEDVQDDGNGGRISKIYLVDATNKAWDITHAVHEYGFDPEGFEFGGGPNAIKPIMDPQFICRGEPGYPEDDSELIVIGARLEGEARAYPLTIMRRHEVANDKFGEAHVTIGY